MRRLAGKLYPIDAVPAGTPSAIIRGISANSRREADAAGRAEWENGQSGDLIRSIGLSRPLGG